MVTMRKLLVLSMLLLAACQMDRDGPWVDESGHALTGFDVRQMAGRSACDQHDVDFIFFFGDYYARDLKGVLGLLVSLDGATPLEFTVLESAPSHVEGTGIRYEDREILVGDDRVDYLYVSEPDGTVERWPRAEVWCEE